MRESVRRRHASVRHRNKHRLAIIGVVVFLVVLCAAAIGIYWYNADQQIQANQAAIEQNEVELKEWQQKHCRGRHAIGEQPEKQMLVTEEAIP